MHNFSLCRAFYGKHILLNMLFLVVGVILMHCVMRIVVLAYGRKQRWLMGIFRRETPKRELAHIAGVRFVRMKDPGLYTCISNESGANSSEACG